MAAKKPKLDEATLKIVRQVLAMPPKHNVDLKLGRPAKKKKRGPKGRASSAKQRSA
jgi:hypothetical protein